ncbi:MAG: flagellar basal body rod protein FlgF, partial [Gammaproteobacteria bacterium]|nr:flagellar basal body rod protein FlgF [Gammaproteobacteria bacterium]
WVEGDGYPARIYGITETPGTDFSEGILQATGRALDIAVEGPGFLTVQLPDGSEAFTRAGDLQLDSAGRLLSRDGLPVLGDGGPIALPPFQSLVVGEDGSLTVRPQGQGPETLVQVERLKLVNPNVGDIVKDASGLFKRADGAPEPADANARVVSGFLESSNVNAVNELTEILSLARQFELEVRMMRTAQSNDETAAQLLQIG